MEEMAFEPPKAKNDMCWRMSEEIVVSRQSSRAIESVHA